MTLPAGITRAYLATRPVDFRKGRGGLALIVQSVMGHEREAGIRAQVAERLTPAARTPTEVQVRSEVRFHVRDMNAPERAKFLMDHSDPVTVAALMEAPAYLCGLTEADRRRMLDANLTEREGLMLSMIEGARQIARDVLVGAWAVAEGPLDAEARASFAEVLGVKPSPIRRGETVAA